MPTVLIAAPASLGALKERSEFTDALAFADTDALRAFEAIARQRATVVVVDAAFAATSRGTALINRIKADPLLGTCDIRILSPDEARPAAAVESASTDLARGVIGRDEGAPPSQTPFAMIDGVELLVDGLSATLVELSVNGAQVVSTTSLKPRQRVRLTLPGSPPLQLNGEIAWAMFEMPAGGPRYRAGVEFIGPDAAKLATFIESNKR